jgi:glycine/D-amino acid oxidase-like deaminating enzyme
MVDYIVVGLGIAGVSFCETLEANGKSFTVISNDSQTSSEVAAGLYNPVILKRFTLAWNAAEQLKMALPFYAGLEKKLQLRLDHKIRVLRRFASIEEQNNWFQAADSPQLQTFLSTEIIEWSNSNIDAPYGFGEVLGTGRIALKKLIVEYSDLLIQKERLVAETFDYGALEIHQAYLKYNSVKARAIVFAEGYGLKQNPYFNYLPLTGTKGELLTIKAPELKEERAIKSSVFLIPLGSDLYRVGATYKWKDKTNTPTREAKAELLEKLNTFLKCDYEVIEHVAGIRPTVTDRRPLVGQHPQHKCMYVLNGLGSRGVLIAPYASKELYQFIEHHKQLHPEMDVERFLGKYRNL